MLVSLMRTIRLDLLASRAGECWNRMTALAPVTCQLRGRVKPRRDSALMPSRRKRLPIAGLRLNSRMYWLGGPALAAIARSDCLSGSCGLVEPVAAGVGVGLDVGLGVGLDVGLGAVAGAGWAAADTGSRRNPADPSTTGS